jgi:hypothetical protein
MHSHIPYWQKTMTPITIHKVSAHGELQIFTYFETALCGYSMKGDAEATHPWLYKYLLLRGESQHWEINHEAISTKRPTGLSTDRAFPNFPID